MQQQPIAIFDSGLGGLSLVQEVRSQLPNESICYLADNAFVPYGSKSIEVIEKRCHQIVDFFVKQNCKAVVIACNTATAIAVDKLRQEFTLPIIAMEPAVKPAAQLNTSGKIAVCATENTLKHPRFQRLVANYAHSVEVLTQACHGWVELVEKLDIDSTNTDQVLLADLNPLIVQQVDAIVLGCTHFPLLKQRIEKLIPASCQLIDPTPAVVEEVKRQLIKAGLLATSDVKQEKAFFTQQVTDYPKHLQFYYPHFHQIELISL